MCVGSGSFSKQKRDSQQQYSSPISDHKKAKGFTNVQTPTHDQSTTIHENKLPVNLFYSAAQYNKMLITNGRSIRKSSEPSIQQFGEGLQFINDTIFESCEQRKQSLRLKAHTNNTSTDRKRNNGTGRKQGLSGSSQCLCCCCEEYCKMCSMEQNKKMQKHVDATDLTQQQLKVALKKINSQPIKKPKKVEVIASNPHLSLKQFKGDKKSKGISNSEKCSSSYLSHKSFQIDNLVCQSLVLFEKEKRIKQFQKLQDQRLRAQHQQLMKKFEEEIRQINREHTLRCKSKSPTKKNKVLHAHNIRAMYWESIRESVAEELRKEKLRQSKSKSKGKDKSKSVACKQQKLSPDMIVHLRQMRQKQAKLKIAREQEEKTNKKKMIKLQLAELERRRLLHIQQCEMRKFEPNEQMIQQAFQNIVEPPKVNQNGQGSGKKVKKN